MKNYINFINPTSKGLVACTFSSWVNSNWWKNKTKIHYFD